jgi:Bifunctional DNA primase/polymerase, N-terminal
MLNKLSYPREPESTTPHLPDLLQKAALDYARKGIPVFPVHSIDETGACTCGGPEVNQKCSPGKHPRTPNGYLDATTNEKLHKFDQIVDQHFPSG